MKAMDAVKEAARRSGVSVISIGPAMGRSPSYVSVKCTKGNSPQANTLAEMLGVCGYELCAVPKGKAPDCAIKVE